MGDGIGREIVLVCEWIVYIILKMKYKSQRNEIQCWMERIGVDDFLFVLLFL